MTSFIGYLFEFVLIYYTPKAFTFTKPLLHVLLCVGP